MGLTNGEMCKRWRLKKKILGLCTRCGKPRQKLKCYCDACRQKEKVERIKRKVG